MPHTPRDQGFRRTPDWAANEATWTAWPSDADEWRGYLGEARVAVAAMCRALAPEPIRLLVRSGESEASARAALGDSVSFERIDFGDIWLRDTGPLFVTNGAALGAVCGRWNGWGGKFVFEHDDAVAASIAAATNATLFAHDLVIEGGAIDVDGSGALLTTRQCLLNDNRNPEVDAHEIERVLIDHLGVERVVWLDRGLAGDHTDGHVDNLARFVGPGRVLCMSPDNHDPNDRALREATQTLAAAGFEVASVPSPGRVEAPAGQLAAASYLNFCVGNHAVVVPVFGVPQDDRAVAIIAELFPNRQTVAVDGRGLLTGGGTFHCITQQQPRLEVP